MVFSGKAEKKSTRRAESYCSPRRDAYSSSGVGVPGIRTHFPVPWMVFEPSGKCKTVSSVNRPVLRCIVNSKVTRSWGSSSFPKLVLKDTLSRPHAATPYRVTRQIHSRPSICCPTSTPSLKSLTNASIVSLLINIASITRKLVLVESSSKHAYVPVVIV